MSPAPATTSRRATRARSGGVGLAGLLLALASVLLGATPAQAHASLLGTDPKDGARLATPPTTVTLQFSERIEPTFVAVNLSVDGGDPQRLETSAAGPRLSADVRVPPGADLTQGATSWRVSYRVVSADGHPITGNTTFQVAPTAASESAGSSASPAPSPSADGSSGSSEQGAAATVEPGQSSQESETGNPWLSTVVIGGLSALVVTVLVTLLARGRRNAD